jgi:hypothetical protein
MNKRHQLAVVPVALVLASAIGLTGASAVNSPALLRASVDCYRAEAGGHRVFLGYSGASTAADTSAAAQVRVGGVVVAAPPVQVRVGTHRAVTSVLVPEGQVLEWRLGSSAAAPFSSSAPGEVPECGPAAALPAGGAPLAGLALTLVLAGFGVRRYRKAR